MRIRLKDTDYMEAWARGFVEKSSAAGYDPEELVKNAQIASTSDVMQGLGKKLYGDSTAGNIANIATDVGTYFIPGVGLVRSTVDAASDFGNMFQKNIGMGDRAKYLASGLGNSLFAGVSLLTGGSNVLGGLARGVRGVVQGSKMLNQGGSVAKGIQRAGTAIGDKGDDLIKGVDDFRRTGFGGIDAAGKLNNPTKMNTLGRYGLGLTNNPYARELKDSAGNITRAAGAGYRPGWGLEGLKSKAQFIGYGAPRQLSPVALMMQRPQGQYEEVPYGGVMPPPAAQNLFTDFNGQRRWGNVS